MIDPDILLPCFIGAKGSFAPVSGPWYAQAYGGDLIPELKAEIDKASSTYCDNKIYLERSWRIELGPKAKSEAILILD